MSVYQFVSSHFDEFERVYPEKYQKTYGFWQLDTGMVRKVSMKNLAKGKFAMYKSRADLAYKASKDVREAFGAYLVLKANGKYRYVLTAGHRYEYEHRQWKKFHLF